MKKHSNHWIIAAAMLAAIAGSASSALAQSVTVSKGGVPATYTNLAEAMWSFRPGQPNAGQPGDNIITIIESGVYANDGYANTNFTGASEGLTIVVAPGVTATFAINRTGNNGGFVFDERTFQGDANSQNGLLIDGSAGTLIMKSLMDDGTADAFYINMTGARNVTLRGIRFEGWVSDGDARHINITHRGTYPSEFAATGVLIENCVFDGSGFGGTGNKRGIHVQGQAMHQVTIRNCQFFNVPYQPMLIAAEGTYSCEDLYMEGGGNNNGFVFNYNDGGRTGRSQTITAKNIYVTKLGGYGVQGNTNAATLSPTNVTIENLVCTGNNSIGVNVEGASVSASTLNLINSYIFNNGRGGTAQVRAYGLNGLAGGSRTINMNFCTVVDSSTTGSITNPNYNSIYNPPSDNVGCATAVSTQSTAGSAAAVNAYNCIFAGRYALGITGEAAFAGSYNLIAAPNAPANVGVSGPNSVADQPTFVGSAAAGDLAFLLSPVTATVANLHLKDADSKGVDMIPESARLGVPTALLTAVDYDGHARPQDLDTPPMSDAGADEVPQSTPPPAAASHWQLLQ